MRRFLLLSVATATAIAVLAGSAAAQPLPAEHALLHQVADQISADQQRATITRLVDFGTRHTASDTRSDTRGIGAARRWVASQFADLARACGGCLAVETPATVFTNARLPTPTEVVDVLAVQRGTSDPGRVIVISGHLDSRVSDPMNATSDAPGANDDASGVAAVMEAARVLSTHRFPATLVYAVLSGEEQSLNGGKILAAYAKAQGWQVEADLNNDIIGNTEGLDGSRETTRVRVFSEGTRSIESPAEADKRRYNGGEVDSPSRQLARMIDGLADRYLTNFDVDMIYRTDRWGRGGDQVEMLAAGFPAVRFTEPNENYHRQHQDVRVENGVRYGDLIEGVDFAYLAQVTGLNVVAMAALALAPAPPAQVDIAGAVTADTVLKWRPDPAARENRLWWRATTDPQWRFSRAAPPTGQATLTGVNIDNWFFGVSAVSAEGYESPVVFPGAAGRWAPLAAAK